MLASRKSFEDGEIDFGEHAPAEQRYGVVHWPRLSRVAVGSAVDVLLNGVTREYTVVGVSRL